MKKIVFLASLVIVALLIGCSGPSAGSPGAAVEKFFNAVEKNDLQAMAEVATPETVQIMAMLGSKAQGTAATYGKIKIVSEDISGDTAKVKASFDNGEEADIDLVKVDGKWKVKISLDK
ncbi:MAG: DUF4878 domain-containing protein [Treponema sp.]|nr:DUF4878 domain-containing protein [Treponema sp.]